MLRISPNAAAAVLAERTSADAAARPFLRVWRRPDDRRAGVSIDFVARIASDDVCSESQGIPLCVQAELAVALTDMVLDIGPPSGGHELVIRPDS